MHNFLRRLAGLSLFLSIALPAVSGAMSQERIVQAIENSRVSMLPGTVHPMARDAGDRGAVRGDLQLRGMSIDFAPSAAQKSALDALVKAQRDPSSASYRQWLTTEEYADRFGMTPQDIAKVTGWLESQGFTVDKVAESRNSIWFSGSASQAEAALHTAIHTFAVEGETHFANTGAIALPSAFAGMVLRVGGLNDFRLKPQAIYRRLPAAVGASPEFTSGASGNHFVAPGDFAVIYDLNPLYTAGFTGAGQTIGVIGQTDIVLSDISAFRSAAGLPVNDPVVFLVPASSDPGISYGDLPEADLDLEWAGGVAPNASIIYVNSSGVLQSLQYAIGNKINGVQIPILTMSYGACESAFSSPEIRSLEASLQQANTQGQTVINSSGDSGAAACDVSSSTTIVSASNGLAVNYPASSSFVTGIGGSEFMGDGSAANPSTGSGQYWGANGTSDLLTSALSYIPEMSWNDTTYSIGQGGGLSAGGGGVSLLFTKPDWQAGVPGIPGDGQRDVPDISFNSSAAHDPYLYCTQVPTSSTSSTYVAGCVNGFRFTDNTLSAVGGTSVAAPAFAGMLALIEQKLGTPQGLGNINPNLYTLASSSGTYASGFHDITDGDNQVPCTTGSTGCTSSGVIGYSAGAGYDLATGLGSVDGANLATALTTIAVKSGSTTTITIAPPTPVAGSAVVLTATVKANSGNALPTGSVSFTVDGVFFTTVPLSGGVAIATTNFATGGPHTVVVDYTGDDFFYASTSTSTFSATPPSGAAASTTALTMNPASIPLYGAVTLSAAIQSATPGTVAGTVTFAIGATSIGSASVTAGANGAGTAILTISSATPALGFVPGVNTITATYGGSTIYGASSGSASLTVTNPGLAMTVSNMTIPSASPGNSGTSNITVTSTGGYSGTVTLTATSTSSLSGNYGFAANPLVIAAGGSASTTITIQTVSASIQRGVAGNSRRGLRPLIAAAGAAFGGILLLGLPRLRRRRWPVLTALLLLTGMSAGLGCGGGGGGSSSGATPSGTYTVTVTATDSTNSALTVSTNFTVTIQ